VSDCVYFNRNRGLFLIFENGIQNLGTVYVCRSGGYWQKQKLCNLHTASLLLLRVFFFSIL